MKIIKPDVELIRVTPNAERLIEAAGRTAYRSEDKITEDSAGEFIRMLLRKEHESVLEHASASLRFIVDRGVSHELVRHRLASYTQESTRYCDYIAGKYGGEITVIEPPGLTALQLGVWGASCEAAEYAYRELRKFGCLPEIARSVLPTCLKTEIVVTANFREWRHILALRTDARAHPQMRQVMITALQLLARRSPICFGDITVDEQSDCVKEM